MCSLLGTAHAIDARQMETIKVDDDELEVVAATLATCCQLQGDVTKRQPQESSHPGRNSES